MVVFSLRRVVKALFAVNVGPLPLGMSIEQRQFGH
jgi:hypothetical protein